MNNTTKNEFSYTYYDILQIPNFAKNHEIKKAYLKLVKKCHPDLFTNRSPREKRLAELRFKLINEAYNHLKNNKTKALYDRQIKQSGRIRLKAINDNPRKKTTFKELINNGWANLTEILWPISPSATKRTINHGR